MSNIEQTSSPALLSMPPELLEFILADVLQPTGYRKGKFVYSEHDPHQELLRRLSRVSACKQLRNMALPAYFRLTRLAATIGTPLSEFTETCRWSIQKTKAKFRVLSGTFADQELFSKYTVKLRIGLAGPDFSKQLLNATAAILSKCGRLTKVTPRCGNLNDRTANRVQDESRGCG